ncbi:MAG: GWxTD domain-containing protein [Bryobacterales bacterium]|nr:GWxTD domain-containing protein [Bryobacterales bacterium]
MNYLASVIDLEAAARSLLHFLWQGTLLAGVAFALRRNPDPQRRYIGNCLLLALMAAAPVVTYLGLSSGPRPTAMIAAISTGGRALPSPSMPAPPAAWFGPVLTVWLIGVVVFAIRAAGGWLWALHQLRRGRQPVPDAIVLSVRRIAQTLAIAVPVRIFQSATVAVPTVLGIFRPMLVLPAAIVTGMPANQLDAILAHELAHIARQDFLINCLQTLVEIALFYHPAVWWLSNTIRHDRELCCDAIAVRLSGDPVTYSHALLALETTRHEFALAATGGNLKARIQHLLRPEEPVSTPAPPLMGILALILIGAGLTVNAQQQPATAYEKWLNEDVVYLIAPEERAAFERLRTDEERNEFIRQFWLRRDPTPGTNVNEMKDEHYRRIAYVNARLSDSRPGWQTDRGRIYIVTGPPDEIEAHPSDLRESWRYHNGSQFEFLGEQYKLIGKIPANSNAANVRHDKRILARANTDLLPEPRRTQFRQRLEPFVNKPFSNALMNEIRVAVHDLDQKGVAYRWGFDPITGNATLDLLPMPPKP